MTINSLVPIGITLVVIAIVLSMGADILSNIQADQTSGSYAYNITGKGLEGVNELGSWQKTIALIVAAAIIIGIILSAFAIYRTRQ